MYIQSLCPFSIALFTFFIEFLWIYEFFTYSEYKLLIRYVIWKYFPHSVACLFHFIDVLVYSTSCNFYRAFFYDNFQSQHENYWKCLTRTISQSTFNSVATASIFSLHTEPRLVMPLSQYFLRVAKSRSLNWVRSCSCKTDLK